MSFFIKYIFFLFFTTTAYAGHLNKEAEYRDAWCMGKSEVTMPNGNRADCVTTDYAVEVEFAKKYHEGVGQALDYAQQTGKSPAILLIIEDEKDWRYYNRLKPLAEEYSIRLWYMTAQQLKQRQKEQK